MVEFVIIWVAIFLLMRCNTYFIDVLQNLNFVSMFFGLPVTFTCLNVKLFFKMLLVVFSRHNYYSIHFVLVV